MAGSIVPVQPGNQPTQVSGSNLDDMTLYNMDSAHALWIGNSASIAPNNGMRIGPLGTARWSKSSGLAYACVDTGVTSPVNLNISNDISNPANPVDVATATAVQLLAQGVPNVLVTKNLANQTVAGGAVVNLDTTGQASIFLEATAADNNANPVVLQLQWIDSATGFAFESFWLTIPGSASTTTASWEMPVMTGQLIIKPLAGGQHVTLLVVGSNRLVPVLRQHYNSYMSRQFIFNNGNFVNGVSITLTPNDTLNGDALTRFNGPVKLSWETFGGAPAATLIPQMTFVGINGALFDHNIYPVVGNSVTVDWYHPPIPVFWRVKPLAAAAGATVILTITPAGSGY